jgi:hypothetical protein
MEGSISDLIQIEAIGQAGDFKAHGDAAAPGS